MSFAAQLFLAVPWIRDGQAVQGQVNPVLDGLRLLPFPLPYFLNGEGNTRRVNTIILFEGVRLSYGEAEPFPHFKTPLTVSQLPNKLRQ